MIVRCIKAKGTDLQYGGLYEVERVHNGEWHTYFFIKGEPYLAKRFEVLPDPVGPTLRVVRHGNRPW